jgi:hypothetical protein
MKNPLMLACLEPAPPVGPAHSPAPARAARLKKFQREQLVVDSLDRGVSVAEIAARIGVGEKRMRTIIREILARRMPHPQMEFVAIQVSRLNEAMLNAFSAMSPTNLKAVAQVVKIVRELDRYGGAFAAEWARPEAPTEADVAFAKAWLGDAELADDEGDDRPDGRCFPLQPRPEERRRRRRVSKGAPERAGTSFETPASRAPQDEGRGTSHTSLAAAGRREIPLQRLEKIESAPGIPAGSAARTPLAPIQLEEDREELEGLSVPAGQTSHPDRLLIPGSSPGTANERPEIPAQGVEKVESAPGIELASRTAAAGPAPAAGLMLSRLRSAAGRQNLRACLSGLRADTHGVAPQGGGDFPFADEAGHARFPRPQDPAQHSENIDFAPGKSGLDEAGSGSLPNPLSPYPIGPGRFYRTLHCVGAC